MTQDRLLIGVKGSPECRRDMLVKHSLSISNSAILNFLCTEVPNAAIHSDSGHRRHAVFTLIFALHH